MILKSQQNRIELVTRPELSQSQKEEVVATGAELLEDQMKKADESAMACLPTLAIKDIAVTAPVYNLDPLSRGFVTRHGVKQSIFDHTYLFFLN